MYVRIRLLSSLDRCRRDVSSWSGGSFSVGSTTFDRLLFDVLRVELAVSFCSMRPEWFEWFIYVDVLLWEPCAGVVSYCRQDCDIRLLSTYLSKGIGVLTIPKDLHHGGG